MTSRHLTTVHNPSSRNQWIIVDVAGMGNKRVRYTTRWNHISSVEELVNLTSETALIDFEQAEAFGIDTINTDQLVDADIFIRTNEKEKRTYIHIAGWRPVMEKNLLKEIKEKINCGNVYSVRCENNKLAA